MPLYDLECSACGEISEDIQTMDAKQPTRCAKCGKRQVRRILLKPPAYHNHFSPLHPRKNRGRGH
jgi:putative FmdB family regulatory protein